jgi:hypothetical protein
LIAITNATLEYLWEVVFSMQSMLIAAWCNNRTVWRFLLWGLCRGYITRTSFHVLGLSCVIARRLPTQDSVTWVNSLWNQVTTMTPP